MSLFFEQQILLVKNNDYVVKYALDMSLRGFVRFPSELSYKTML